VLKKHPDVHKIYKESVAKKRKRDRSPSSTFSPSTASKKSCQEDIVTALVPAAIANKKL
jgi:hypothetical protein